MHVGIVLHPFGNSSKGLEQYVFESARSMIEESKSDVSFTVFVKGSPDVAAFGPNIHVVHLPDSPLWKLHLLLWRKKCDTFIFFTESAPIFLWRKSIIVFFDAAYYYFGGTGHLARLQTNILVWWRGLMMRTVRHIVTISEASKIDLVNIFRLPATHVSVIYPGFKALLPAVDHSREQIGRPYFMYVGPIKERKNVAAIVEAFTEFKKISGLPHELYLVGRASRGAYENRVHALIEASPYKEAILFKTSVSDEALRTLYTQAEALVFPSLLEGFGLPVLEALSCECMVITSSTTSTKEALGESGILVDPRNYKEIAEAMLIVSQGGYDRDNFTLQAARQCAKFSWERSGKAWYAMLKNGASLENK